MQRLQGWVRYAAEGLSQRAGNFQQQQTQDSEDEEDFIYARVQVHSDDEDVGGQGPVMARYVGTQHLLCTGQLRSNVRGH